MCVRCLSSLLAGYHPLGVFKFMKNEKLSPVCVSVSDVMRPEISSSLPVYRHSTFSSFRAPRHSLSSFFSRETAKSDICPSGPRRFGHAVAHKARRRLTQVRKPAEASGGDLVCSDTRHILVNVDVHVLLAG